ncbi:hypothetical protein LJC63_08590 [Ruminococcaceae bacterium OttesenSCG-928-L11]|nr:hypothetical protein [Ruminococcaceae bacterium OttesenSCG-928-L11]
MKWKDRLRKKVDGLHIVSKYAISIGALTMIAFYITAGFARLIAPHVDYFIAMNICYGCLEAAPASLVAGVCAGLLGDLMLSRHTDKKD